MPDDVNPLEWNPHTETWRPEVPGTGSGRGKWGTGRISRFCTLGGLCPGKLVVLGLAGFFGGNAVYGDMQFFEEKVGVKPVVWFEAGDATPTDWPDKSGNGRDAVKVSGDPNPVANVLGGKAVVEFRRANGDDEYLLMGDPFIAKEHFYVFRSPNDKFNNYAGILGHPNGRGSNYLFENINTYFHSNQRPSNVTKNGVDLADPYDLAPITDFMVMRLEVNNGNLGPHSGYKIGEVDKVYSADIDLAEIVAFDKVLSADQRKKLEGFLAVKYGLVSQLPGDHPYNTAWPTVSLEGDASMRVQKDSTFADPGVTASDPEDGVLTDIVKSYRYEYSVPGDANDPPVLISGVTAISPATGYQDIRIPQNTVNGSGLVDGKHDTAVGNLWMTDQGDTTPEIVYDLGKPYDLVGLHIWNHNQAGNVDRGVRSMEILVDDDPAGGSFTSVGEYILDQASGAADDPGQALDLSSEVDNLKQVRLVKFDIKENFGGGYTGLSEVQFSGVGLKVFTELDTAYTGEWKVKYTATDSNGQTASVERDVLVFDPDGPVLTMDDGLAVHHEQGTPFVDLPYTVKDKDGNAIDTTNNKAVVTGTVDPDVPGQYVLTYNFTDDQGRRAEPVRQTVTVSDTVAPAIDLVGSDTIKLAPGQKFIDPGALGTDLADGVVLATSSRYMPNKILMRGFHGNMVEEVLIFDSNGGMLEDTPLGETYLDQVLSFNGDTSFRLPGTNITHGDRFRALFLSTFVALREGEYEFGIDNPDDRGSFWMDLDQDGIFELEAGEWMNGNYSGGYKTVHLKPGYYKVAIGFLENTGGSRIDAKFRTPKGAGPDVLFHIDPTHGNQDGLWVEANPLDTFVPGTYTITYTATDLAGNTSTATRTIEISEAIEPPVLTLEGRPIIKHPVGADFTDPGVKLTGPAGEDLSAELPKVVVTGTVDTSVPGDYELMYSYTGDDNIAAEPISRIVQVLDATPPTIELVGDAAIEYNIGEVFTDPGLTITDNLDTDVPWGSTAQYPSQNLWLHVDAGQISGIEPGGVLPVWTNLVGNGFDLSDVGGDPTLKLDAINGKPAVHVDGDDYLAITRDIQRVYSVFTVSQLDGSRNGTLFGAVNGNWALGYYNGFQDLFWNEGWVTRQNESAAIPVPHLYSATSNNGVSRFWADGVEKTFSPNVNGRMLKFQIGRWRTENNRFASGDVAEVLIYDGRAVDKGERLSIEYRLGTKYNLPGFPDHTPPDLTTPGDYTILYIASDSSGNLAFATRDIKVNPNPDLPVIAITGDLEIVHEVGTDFTDPGHKITDSGGTEIPNEEATITGTVDKDTPGLYELRYNYDDGNGNVASEVVRTVLVADTTAPVISLTGETEIRVEVGAEYSEPGATATDTYDTDVHVEISHDRPIHDWVPGLLGGTLSGNSNNPATQPNPGNLGIDPLGPTEAQNSTATLGTAWATSMTIVYSGQMYDEDGQVSLMGSIDDQFYIFIDQQQVLTGSGWTNAQGKQFNLGAGDNGWHDIEFRMYNGGGGGGNTNPLGLGIDKTGTAPTVKDPDRTQYEAPLNSNPNTMDLFRVMGTDYSQFDTSITGTFEITYTATDDAGNTDTKVRKLVIVEDAGVPFIVLNGESHVELEADSSGTYTDPGAVVKAANGTDVLVASLAGEGTVDPTTPGTYEIRYFHDGAKFVKRTVEVVDTTPPVITLAGDQELMVYIGNDYVEPGASGQDAVDGATAAVSELAPLPDHLTYDVHLETYADWQLDFSGNGGILGLKPVGSIAFRSLEDVVGIDFPNDTSMRDSHPNLNQTDRFQLVFHGYFNAKRDGEYEFETTNVDDRCAIWLDKDLDGTFERPGDLGDERLTWGDQSSAIYLDKGMYRFALGFMENGGGARFRGLFRTPAGAGPESKVVIDPADPAQAGIWFGSGKSLDTSVPGFHRVAYTAIDKSGNSSIAYRNIIVMENPNRPVLQMVGAEEIRHQAGKDYEDPGVLLEDAQGNILDETQVVVENLPDGLVPGIYEILYSFTDAQGNSAKPLERLVIVEDTVAPGIQLTGGDSISVSVGQPYVDPGASATDLLDGTTLVLSSVAGIPQDGLILHLDAVFYKGKLADGAEIDLAWDDLSGEGNHADVIKGNPTWNEASTHGQPAVEFDGSGDIIHTTTNFEPQLQNYTILTITRYTIFANDGHGRIVSSRNRNWCLGSFQNSNYKFYADGWIHNVGGVDDLWHSHVGDASDKDRQNFWVDGAQLAKDVDYASDTTYMPREINLGGYNDGELSKSEISEVLLYNRILPLGEREFILHALNSKYGLGGIVKGSMPLGPIDTSAPGEHTVHYFSADAAGNIGSARRTVTVVDTPLPVIALTGAPVVEHTANQPYTDAGATLQDSDGNPIPGTPVPLDKVDVTTPGQYTFTYTFDDGQGNVASPAVRIVHVLDKTAPVLVLTGGNEVELQTGNEFKDPGFTVSDDVDGETDIQVTVSTFHPDQVRTRIYRELGNNNLVDLHTSTGLLSKTPVVDTFFSNLKAGEVRVDNQVVLGDLHEKADADNTQLIFSGHFHSATGGTYEFGIEQPDDRGVFWIDLDSDGEFEIDGDLGDERMNADQQFGYRTINLGPGYHEYAIAFNQGGGGASIRPRYRAIRGAGPTALSYIRPADPVQQGQWVIWNPVNGKSPGEQEITYTATDSAGNVTTVVRKVIVRSNPDAAVIHLAGEAEVGITVGGTYTEAGSTLTDLEGNTVPGSASTTGEVNTDRPGRYILEYDFKDAQGVAARTVRRIVNIVDDVAPAITLDGAAETIHFQGTPFVDPGATAQDNYDGNLPVGSSEIVMPDGLLLHLDASSIINAADGGKVTEWHDLSGKGNHANQSFGNPVLVANALNGKAAVRFDGLSRLHTLHPVGLDYTILTVSRLSGISNQKLLTSLDQNWYLGYAAGLEDSMFVANGWVNQAGAAATTNPHVYSATSGNRMVKLYSDGRDITVFGSRRDNNYNMGTFQMGAYLQGSEASTGDVAEVMIFDHILPQSQRQGLEALLNATYSLNGLSGVNIPVNPQVLGEYHIVYQAIDNAGNLATEIRKVTVVPDPAAPVITLVGDSEVQHEAGDPYVDAGATLKDKDGNDLDAALIKVDNPVQANVPGQYTITYNYESDRGKVAAEISRVVFINDTLPPEMTLLGDEVVKLEVGGTFTDPGATALDKANGALQVSSSLEVVVGQLHHWGYKGQNNSGALDLDQNGGLLGAAKEGIGLLTDGPNGTGLNFVTAAEFFTPLADTGGNAISIQGDWFQMLFHGVFIVPVDGEYELGFFQRDYETSIWIDLNQNGTFEAAGGERLMGLTDAGFAPVNLQAGYYDFAFVYRENNGGEVIQAGVTLPYLASGEGLQKTIHPENQMGLWGTRNESGLDTSKAGSHTITYLARDISGNVSTVERTVIVVDDPTLPFISLNGGLEVTHEAGTPFVDPAAVVKDQDGDVLEPNLQGQGTVDVDTPGEYTLTYDYTDGTSGESAETLVRKVIVVDTSDPVLTLVAHPIYGGTDEVRFLAGRPWEDPGVNLQDADPDAFWVSDRNYLPNRLLQFGYNLDPVEEYLVNLEGNGGLMAMPTKASAYFTDGPRRDGYDYYTDNDFRSLPIGIEGDDDYGMLTLGYFRAKVTGRYEFRTENTDRYQSLWLDLDNDGVFSRNGRLGDERITYRDATARKDIEAGFYRFALGYATYGGNRARAKVKTPVGAGPSEILTNIQPSSQEQNGLWFAEGKGGIDSTQPGEYTITYHGVDKWGNTATKTRKVIVEADPDAPVLTLVGDAEIIHGQGTVFTDPKVTAKDAGGTGLDASTATALVSFGGRAVALVDGNIPGEYQIRYDFIDSQGRPAIPVYRKVMVADTTPPVITLVGDSTVYASPGAPYYDLGATASDSVDGEVQVVLSSTSPQEGYVPGLLAGSMYGNISNLPNPGNMGIDPLGPSIAQEDTNPPWRDDYTYVYTGEIYDTDGIFSFREAIGDKAQVFVDNQLILDSNTQNDQLEALVDVSFGGWFPFEVRMSGNNVAPYGAMENLGLGFDPEGGEEFVQPKNSSPEAMDRFRFKTLLHDTVDTSQESTHTITFTATDAAGNTSTLVRTIIVQEDALKPILKRAGEGILVHEAMTPFTAPVITLEDARGNLVTGATITQTGEVDIDRPGMYTLTYNASHNGRAAAPLAIEVQVVDTTPPSISVVGANPAMVSKGSVYTDPGALAVDSLDGELGIIDNLQFLSNGLELHLDATSLAATLADGDPVTLWEDLSGMDIHMDKKRGDPTFVAASTHGRPAVNFDGDDQLYSDYSFQGNTEYTILSIARYTGGQDGRVITSNSRNWLFGFHADKVRAFHSDGWLYLEPGSDMDWHLHAGHAKPGGIGSFWMDDEHLADNIAGLHGSNYRPVQIYLGAYQNMKEASKCEISELIYYNRILNAIERNILFDYLNSKYSLNGGGDYQLGPVDTSVVGERKVYYRAMDKHGNETVAFRTVVVTEAALPVITLNGGAQATHGSGQPYADPGVVIEDGQGNVLQETPVVTGSVDSDIPGEYVLAYDYTDTDGNPATTVLRTVTVTDNSPPVITLVGGDTYVHQLGNPFEDPGYSAFDNGDGKVAVSTSILQSDIIRASYFATQSGNWLDITENGGLLGMAPDIINPQFVTSPLRNAGLYVDGGDNLNDTNDWVVTFPGISTLNNFMALFEGHFHTKSGGRYEFGIEQPDDRGRFYLDLDQDGAFELQGGRGPEQMNSEDWFGYRQVDLEPGFYKYAVVYLEGGGGARIDARYRAVEGDGPPILTRIYPGQADQKGQWVQYNPINTLGAGEYDITYTSTDSHGHTATAVRKVIVKNQPEAAVITLLGDAEMDIPFGQAFTDPGTTLTDIDGNPVSGEVMVHGEVDTEAPGEYRLAYTFTNAGGFTSRQRVRKVHVVDNTPPVVTLGGAGEMTHYQGMPFLDPGASVRDDVDGVLVAGSSHSLKKDGMVMHLDASSIPGKADGDPITAWLDLSGAGNHASEVQGTPTYSSNGIQSMPAVYFDGFSALSTSRYFGNRYTVITVSRLAGGADQRLLSSADNINWTMGYDTGHEDYFRDGRGEVTFMLKKATTDVHLYTVTSSGSRTINFYSGGILQSDFPKRRDDYQDIGRFQMGAWNGLQKAAKGFVSEVIVYDHALEDIERKSIEAYLGAKYGLNGLPKLDVPVNPGIPGEYNIVYEAIDSSGNRTVETRKVTVVPNPSAPSITLAGDAFVEHEAGEAFVDPGYLLKDKDGNVLDSALVVVSTDLDPGIPGVYSVAYNYIPATGLPATEMARQVWVRDTLPPAITLNGKKDVRLKVGEPYVEEGASALDLASGSLPVINSQEWHINALLKQGFTEPRNNYQPLILDNNGGLLAATPLGSAPFSTGPNSNGMDFGNNAQFWANIVDENGDDPTPTDPTDDYQILWSGFFFAPAAGTYEFGIEYQDDRSTIYLDLNQNGIFEDAMGEMIVYINQQGNYPPVSLQPGVYQFAMAFAEGGGGERVRARFSLPPVNGKQLFQEVINPSKPAQAGLWAYPVSTPLDTSVPGVQTIRYLARDGAGNIAEVVRTIHVVVDDSVPFISLNGLPEIIHEAGEDFTDPGATVTSGAGTELSSNLQGVGTVDKDTVGEYTLTYDYNDSGKDAVQVTRTVTVVDTTKPTITLNGDASMTITAGSTFTDPGVITTDVSGDPLVVSGYIPHKLEHRGYMVDLSPTTLMDLHMPGNIFEETPSGTDYFTKGPQGNGWFYNSDAEFTGDPIGIIRNDWYQTLTTGFFYAKVDGDYTFRTDNTDNYLQFWVDLDQDGAFEQPGELGNERLTSQNGTGTALLSVGFYRVALVYMETTGGARGRLFVQTPDGAGPSDALAVVKPTDPAQAGLWFIQGHPPVDTTFTGTYPITYYAIDGSGNIAKIDRTVIVEPDPSAPVLHMAGDEHIAHEIGAPYTDQLPEIKDQAGQALPGTPNSTVKLDGADVPEVDGMAAGVYEITYTFTDGSNRSAIPISRTVTVADTIAPVITLTGDADITVLLGSEYKDAGATVSDAHDQDVTLEVTSSKPVETYVPGLLGGTTRTWSTTTQNPGNVGIDPLGPTAAQMPSSTNYPWDTNTMVIYTGEFYDADGVFAFREDIDERARIAINGVQMFEDTQWNVATEHQADHGQGGWFQFDLRMWNGGGGGGARSLGVQLEADSLLGANGNWVDPENSDTATADLFRYWAKLHDTVDARFEGVYTITYTATDDSGNTSTAVRTINVEDDFNRPVITLEGGKDLIHEAGDPFTEPGYSVANRRGDSFDASKVVAVGSVDHTQTGEYLITYNFSDAGKDAPQVTRKISVVDTTAPVIELTGGEFYRVAIGADYTEPGVTVTDNLDTGLGADAVLTLDGLQPILHWEFDETDGTEANELMASLDGTLINFPDLAAARVLGKYGNALSFTGANASYVEIPGTDKLDLQAFTISVWVKTDNYNRSMFLFEKSANDTVNSQYNLFFENDDTFTYRTIDDAANIESVTVSSSANFIPDVWQHIAVTYDGTDQLLYIQGEFVDSSSPAATIATNPAGKSYIGAHAPGTGYYFTGLIDDLKIYSFAVTEAQIPEIQKQAGVDTSIERKAGNPYTFTYTAKDSNGNTSTIERRIVISNDQTPPTLTLNGDEQIQFVVGTDWTDPMASANDVVDGDLSFRVAVSGTVDTNKEGVYELTYDVMDLSYNAAPSVTRTVNVISQQPTDPLEIWTNDKLSTVDEAKRGVSDDPDRDRVPNLLEYALGGDPAKADRRASLPEAKADGASLQVTFLRIKSSVDPTITYKVELARKLKNGTWREADVTVNVDADQSGVPDDYEKVTATSTTPIANETQGRQFIRITVERP